MVDSSHAYGDLHQGDNILGEDMSKEELETELKKTEEEIQTLKSVLSAKMKYADDLKQRLGLSWKHDLASGWHNIRESDAFKKTKEGLSTVGEKTTSALATLKNSTAFKSFEDRISGAVSTVKSKVSGSTSEQNFDEALKEATEAAQAEQK